MKYNSYPLADLLRSPKTVFTFKDISLIWGSGNKQAVIAAIHYYVKTGKLISLRRGIYAKNADYNTLELATRIMVPSYISFETVLAKAGIIFQYYEKITVASYQTRNIKIGTQMYSYKKLHRDLLSQQAGIKHENETSIATPERAFLDMIYIHKEYHFDNTRPLVWDKIFELLPLYKNKRMIKNINLLYKNHP